ncbi:MAG: hypothetical protein QOG72_1819 [Sphingomonadales bacterium]|jgi:hypothetical protein|nr:hypothetical protein [Sphingomonadales bacterium]
MKITTNVRAGVTGSTRCGGTRCGGTRCGGGGTVQPYPL